MAKTQHSGKHLRLALLFMCLLCFAGLRAQELSYEELFRIACKSVVSDSLDIQVKAGELLSRLSADPDAPEKIRLNSNLILANLYVNFYDTENLGVVIGRIAAAHDLHPEWNLGDNLESLRELHRQMLEGKSYIERLCGTWVSLERDYYHKPAEIVEIGQDSLGFYAKLKPSCLASLLPKEKMTRDVTIITKEGRAEFYFGNEKTHKGNKMMAVMVAEMSNELSKNAAKSIAANTKKPTVGSELKKSSAELAGMLGQWLAYKMSLTTEHVYFCKLEFRENPLIPEVSSMQVIYSHKALRSDGKTKEEKEHYLNNLYKLEPQDSISFSDRNGWVTEMPVNYKFPKRKDCEVRAANDSVYTCLFEKFKRKLSHLTVSQRESEEFDELETRLATAEAYQPNYNDIIVGVREKIFIPMKNFYYGEGTDILHAPAYIKKNGESFFFSGYHVINNMDFAISDDWKYIPISFEIHESEGRHYPVYGCLYRESDKEKVYEGYVKDYKMHGKGKEYYDDGSYYEGNFRNDLRHGAGTLYDKDGNVLQTGTWKKGKLQPIKNK